MTEREFVETGCGGLLAIGDPHLEGRVPGFRKDDYPARILEKLAWCLDYARRESLVPVLLGDLFHRPRSNPNWLLVSVMQLFDRQIPGIYGNHDVHENSLTDDDSIRVIAESGNLVLLNADRTYPVLLGGRPVIIGGTPWGQRIPERFDRKAAAGKDGAEPLVIWLIHHDTIVPGYEEQGKVRVREIPGVDLVINGHIHRCLGEVQKGATRWIVPGNISRRARSDAAREHVPAVLRVDIDPAGASCRHVTVPHQPFEAVFHESVETESGDGPGSAFVAGLAELQARRTQTGEGLALFLERNLGQFDAAVAAEIRKLAKEVIPDE